MKRKTLLTLLILTISATPLSACKSAEPVENSETIETTAVESEATEQTEQTETTEEVRNKMFGLDDITASEDKTSETNTSSETTRTDYPDSRSDHQKAWDDYKESWDDFSVYGTATKGKTENDFPYYGPTGYDVTLLEERTTDKGYTVMYDTNTGKVYYSGMMLPTGSIWDDTESGGVLATYAYAKGYNSGYDVTYSEMQEVLGVYNGD